VCVCVDLVVIVNAGNARVDVQREWVYNCTVANNWIYIQALSLSSVSVP
jgi:hypothetical protein